uniref:Uncharacterized protein n=1 Tax=Chelonoidis abingdonii TaxID=106734 RepID=A0A8C0IMN8_CHEAB
MPTSLVYYKYKTKKFTSEKRISTINENNLLSLDMSSAHWLKTHGLVARRLTIMDALAPTAVPHSTKYIPVLDKRVVSKVFDEHGPDPAAEDGPLLSLFVPLSRGQWPPPTLPGES